MSEYALVGDELKRMVNLAKKQPLPFAYCPGPDTPADLLALHRTKTGEVMAKDLRSSGEGSKVAFGTASVEDKVMGLTCDRHLPNMAKRLKKFLKLHKVMLNVQVLDADGNLVDSDIEELSGDVDDPSDEGPGSENEEAPAPPGEAEEAKARVDETAVRALAERFKAMQPFVMSVTGPNAEALRKVLATGIGMLRAGDIAQAEKAVLALENVRSRGAEPVPAAPPVPPAARATTDDGALRALAARLLALAPRVGAAPPEMTDRLRASLTAAVGAVKANDAARAGQLVTAIETALDRIAGATAAPKEPSATAEAQAAIPQGIAAKRAYLVSRWAEVPRQIEVPMLAFCAEVAEQLPYEDPQELLTAATGYFSGMVEKIRTAINDALDEDINAGDPVYAGTRRQIAAQRKLLEGDPVVAALADNGLVPGAGFAAAFANALGDLDMAMAS